MVTANQRDRLFGAMVAVVAERGYDATRVADVSKLSGVSRSAFYELFDDKLDCFLATVDAIVDSATESVAAAYGMDGGWEDRLRAALDTLVELVVAQPAAARLCLVETHAAGPEAVERVQRRARALGRLASAALRDSPERAGMPPEVVRAVLGGTLKVVETRVRLGHQRELPALVPQLLEWALSYRTPPEQLKPPSRRPAMPAAAAAAREDAARERILRAMTELVAEKGYPSATVSEVSRRAAVSLTTFYAIFDGKEQAFLAALDDTTTRLLAATLPAYRAATDWPHAVHDGLGAFLAYLSSETAAARLAGHAAWAAGPAAMEHVDKGLHSFEALLVNGSRRRPTPEITAEAVGGSISSLIYDQLRREQAERLYLLTPTATFVALAPYIGTIEACAIASGAG